jgi:cell division septation protein DedD
VVALDLSRPGLPRVGTIAGGAEDLWLPVAWSPTPAPAVAVKDSGRANAARAVGADSSADAIDAAPDTVAGARTSAPAQRVYLQVSSSQNPDWARDLSQQLRSAGVEATVLQPHGPGDPYRVVVGPYESREAAEEASRKLGRPSFIIAADSAGPEQREPRDQQ